ncbi:hypothetical protein WH47_11032 [Habropoda laboriosa]|uniref:Uncharacterized protein n=1 Tax=Habropoda laboriosa TaxID=597456 RepID=A0A0L7QL98_9HYME|nr:hypothetical protein WH47_11032 [Habropoda laboriosa]
MMSLFIPNNFCKTIFLVGSVLHEIFQHYQLKETPSVCVCVLNVQFTHMFKVTHYLMRMRRIGYDYIGRVVSKHMIKW